MKISCFCHWKAFYTQSTWNPSRSTSLNTAAFAGGKWSREATPAGIWVSEAPSISSWDFCDVILQSEELGKVPVRGAFFWTSVAAECDVTVPEFILHLCCVERAVFRCRMDRISVVHFPRGLLLEAAARRDFGNCILVRMTMPRAGSVGFTSIKHTNFSKD